MNFKLFCRKIIKTSILFFFTNALTKRFLENKLFFFNKSNFLLSITVENLNSNPHIIKNYQEKYGKNFQKIFWNSKIAKKWHKDFESSKLIDEYFDLVSGLFTVSDFRYVLDVGCGHGLLTSKLSYKFKNTKFFGIDISENAINEANQNFKCENLEFSLKSFFSIDSKFDFIFSVSAVDYINENEIEKFIFKMLNQSSQFVIISSLRGVNFSDFLKLKNTTSISRYDIGYVHPINRILNSLNQSINLKFKISKCGFDSVFVHVNKISK